MIRLAALAATALFVSPLAVPPRTPLDHIVVAVRSLDEGIAQFSALTGVSAGIGGKHPGRGTENALVSLGGGSYLEIIAPQKDARLSSKDEAMRRLTRLTIVDWAIRVVEVDDALASLRAAGFKTSPPQPGARLTPTGERLDWMTFGLTDAAIATAPFFIRWSPNTRHPSTTAPSGCALERLVVHDPAADRLQAVMKALDVSAVTVSAGAPSIEAALTCGAKRATLSGAP